MKDSTTAHRSAGAQAVPLERLDNRRMRLASLRRARQLTQAQLAETLDMRQPSISKLENQEDMYLSTLRRYIEALGGEMEVVARFPDGVARIDLNKALAEDY